MKAISVRQPWANLIMEGKKKLDLRTYKINHTGPLAIHASSIVEVEDCERFSLNAKQLPKGAILGYVELVDISELDERHYQQAEALHLNQRSFRSGLFGWLFKDPKALEMPIKFNGRQGVFNVPDAVFHEDVETIAQIKRSTRSNTPWDPEKPFQLHVIPERGSSNQYRLAIYHPIIKPKDDDAQLNNGDNPELVKVVEIGGRTLHLVADHVLDALRENGYKPTDLSPNRMDPFLLDEVDGVRLGLLFLAVKPITKLNRVEDISHEIRMMAVEELYYWYSKCITEPSAERAQKALRVMLAAE